jgi:hypothetical protein
MIESELRKFPWWAEARVDIRHATPEDRELFLSLWGEFAGDIRENGYELLWTDRTRDFFGRLFDSYVSGELDGVVLLAGADGALIWGEVSKEPPYDTAFGRIAYSWGSYLRKLLRRMHISSQMRAIAIGELRDMGFDSILGAARKNNVAGYQSALKTGFVEHSMNGVLRLNEEV